MKQKLLKTLVAVLAIAAAAAGPVRGQTTYNVTFGGFAEPAMNTTVNVASLPQAFTAVGDYGFYPFTVISSGGSIFTSASVTSGGEGKVSVNIADWSPMTITVSGTFEGTATIHVEGEDYYENVISRDITVACTLPPAPPVPHTVRFASGNDGWTVTDVDSARSATAPAVLQNVMAGDSLVVTAPATLPGKVKSVKAVKYVAPAATVTTAPTATEAYIEVGSTSALVNAGAANGGTMMYAVTSTNAQPASTADFSATRPTAQGRTPGTYYVWFYAKADADHSDSEIAGPVSVTLPVITTVTINQSDWGESGKSFTKDGVTVSVGNIDRGSGNLQGGGTFSTTLGNFTRIVVTTGSCEASGTGWSGSYSSMTWAGTPASTVSFNGNFMGMGMVQTTIVCTIVPTN